MIPADMDFPIEATPLTAPAICFPFHTILEIRNVAACTLLTDREIQYLYGLSETMLGIFLRGEAVQVNLFWDGYSKEAKGRILVTTLKGEEILGRYLCWQDFFQAARENNWLYREDFSPLNVPRLPDLHHNCRNFFSGKILF